ncbi:MAG: hypothetical protein NTY65_18375 [Planctomycetota bacterium]|nr:hypothetical protein [Planctomycetota bacterium]
MKYLACGTLILGMVTLVQGAAAFYLRINLFTGIRYGPSLMPVYIIFTGVGVCVAGLAFKTIADRRNQKEQQPANNEQPQAPSSADHRR